MLRLRRLAVCIFAGSVLGTAVLLAAPPSTRPSLPPSSVPPERLTLSDAFPLLREGREFPASQIAALEAKLAANPAELPLRLRLAGYYSLKCTGETNTPQYTSTLLGIVQHHPRSPLAGEMIIMFSFLYDAKVLEQGAKLWDQHLQANPNDAYITGNAAAWFAHMLANPAYNARAEALLFKARKLDPNNPRWAVQLASHYLDQMVSQQGDERAALGKKALAELEYVRTLPKEAQEATSTILRDPLLVALAETAYYADQPLKAREYATTALKNVSQEERWNRGNIIHDMNRLLGHIALRQDRIADAKAHLLAAGKTPGSPQLNSFGPNLSLAKALLEKGERATVLQYFDLCEKFWRNDDDQVDASLVEYKRAVQAGQTPDFGRKARD